MWNVINHGQRQALNLLQNTFTPGNLKRHEKSLFDPVGFADHIYLPQPLQKCQAIIINAYIIALWNVSAVVPPQNKICRDIHHTECDFFFIWLTLESLFTHKIIWQKFSHSIYLLISPQKFRFLSQDFFSHWIFIYIYLCFRITGPLLSLLFLPITLITPRYSSALGRRLRSECSGRRSCRLTGAVLKALSVLWSGLSETHSDHGHERDQSLGRTRLNGDGERRARHHAERQTQNLGGKSAEDEKRVTRKRNVGWKIWLSSLLCRIRHRTRKCLEISLFMWKKRRR